MDLGFSGSKAVVTGGSKGMGLAIAETLAAEGASVAVIARGKRALDSAVERLSQAGAPDAVAISADMADAASITSAFAAVSERWGNSIAWCTRSDRATGTSRNSTTPLGMPRSRWARCRGSGRFAPRCPCCAPRTGPAL